MGIGRAALLLVALPVRATADGTSCLQRLLDDYCAAHLGAGAAARFKVGHTHGWNCYSAQLESVAAQCVDTHAELALCAEGNPRMPRGGADMPPDLADIASRHGGCDAEAAPRRAPTPPAPPPPAPPPPSPSPFPPFPPLPIAHGPPPPAVIALAEPPPAPTFSGRPPSPPLSPIALQPPPAPSFASRDSAALAPLSRLPSSPASAGAHAPALAPPSSPAAASPPPGWLSEAADEFFELSLSGSAGRPPSASLSQWLEDGSPFHARLSEALSIEPSRLDVGVVDVEGSARAVSVLVRVHSEPALLQRPVSPVAVLSRWSLDELGAQLGVQLLAPPAFRSSTVPHRFAAPPPLLWPASPPSPARELPLPPVDAATASAVPASPPTAQPAAAAAAVAAHSHVHASPPGSPPAAHVSAPTGAHGSPLAPTASPAAAPAAAPTAAHGGAAPAPAPADADAPAPAHGGDGGGSAAHAHDGDEREPHAPILPAAHGSAHQPPARPHSAPHAPHAHGGAAAHAPTGNASASAAAAHGAPAAAHGMPPPAEPPKGARALVAGSGLGQGGHPTGAEVASVFATLLALGRHGAAEESELLSAFSRHWVDKPLTLAFLLGLGSLLLLALLGCVLCCVLQPCIVSLLRCLGLRSRPFAKLEEDEAEAVYRYRPPFWWRSEEQQEQARRRWILYLHRLGDHAGARRLGWDGRTHPEAEVFAARLQRHARAMAAALRGRPPTLAVLDIASLRIVLARQLVFAPGARTFVRGQGAGNEALLREIAAVIGAANEGLDAAGQPPLAFAIEYHCARRPRQHAAGSASARSGHGSGCVAASAPAPTLRLPFGRPAGARAERAASPPPSSTEAAGVAASLPSAELLELSAARAREVQSVLVGLLLFHYAGITRAEMASLLQPAGFGDAHGRAEDTLEVRLLLPSESAHATRTLRPRRRSLARGARPSARSSLLGGSEIALSGAGADEDGEEEDGALFEEEEARRTAWVRYYLDIGDRGRAAALGWVSDEEAAAARSPQRTQRSSAARSAAPSPAQSPTRVGRQRGAQGATAQHGADATAHGCSLPALPPSPRERADSGRAGGARAAPLPRPPLLLPPADGHTPRRPTGLPPPPPPPPADRQPRSSERSR